MPREFSGYDRTKGRYRITFPPQEEEFSSEHAVNDAVRHSAWGEDRDFLGEVKVELIESTVPVESHPWQCRGEDCSYVVSDDATKPCFNCGKVNWGRRVNWESLEK